MQNSRVSVFSFAAFSKLVYYIYTLSKDDFNLHLLTLLESIETVCDDGTYHKSKMADLFKR